MYLLGTPTIKRKGGSYNGLFVFLPKICQLVSIWKVFFVCRYVEDFIPGTQRQTHHI